MKKVVMLIVALTLIVLFSADLMAYTYNYYATLDFIASGEVSYGLWSTIASYRNETSVGIYWKVEVSNTNSYYWSLTSGECDLANISKSSSNTTYHYEDDNVPPRSVAYLKERTNRRTDVYDYTKWQEWCDESGIIHKTVVYKKDAFNEYSWDDYTFTHSSI